MDHLLLSMNIQILPSSFYPEKKQGLLTPEGVEEDLEKVVYEEKGIKWKKMYPWTGNPEILLITDLASVTEASQYG